MYSVGIDISMNEFHVSLKEKIDGRVVVRGSKKFSNKMEGFTALYDWVNSKTHRSTEVVYVMEATGCYYESLSHYLHSQEYKVHVLQPNTVKYFSKSHSIKTKTDTVDAGVISLMGLERELKLWLPMSKDYLTLRDMVREHVSLKEECSGNKNQLHAMAHSHGKDKRIIDLKNKQIEFKQQQMAEIEKLLRELVKQDESLADKVANVQSIPGLGFMTVITLLCETNGFHNFTSISQTVSYAGLDVEMKQSGNFKGQTRITKRGNKRIRQCLYMPALTAIKHNQTVRELYGRILANNPGRSRKGIVAGMRKLLVLAYTLSKKMETYNPNYVWANGKEKAKGEEKGEEKGIATGNDETKPSFFAPTENKEHAVDQESFTEKGIATGNDETKPSLFAPTENKECAVDQESLTDKDNSEGRKAEPTAQEQAGGSAPGPTMAKHRIKKVGAAPPLR